jgi:carbon storage regulator CsrA
LRSRRRSKTTSDEAGEVEAVTGIVMQVFLFDRDLLSDTGAGAHWTVIHNPGGTTMLVVTRKSQEAVVVGGSDRFERMLKVTVLEIRSGKVKLGFEVDAEIPVHRWEIWEQIRANGQAFTRPMASR